MAKLLLIEDDQETSREIRDYLTGQGYDVSWAATGTEGLERATNDSWDVIVVDRLLPGLDGIAIVEALGQQDRHIPILVLSALGTLDDRVRGLRAGGDDYLVKPFALLELSARLEALLRRPADSGLSLLHVGPLELDLIRRMAHCGTTQLDLLPREFRLLEFFMRRPGQIVTRAMLLEGVWNYRFVPRSNLIDVHIGNLRRKLASSCDATLIQNVRGIGYVLNAS